MADSPTGFRLRYAGFWLRLFAAAIDVGVVLMLVWIFGLVIGADIAALEPDEANRAKLRAMWIAALAVGWFYFAGMESTAPQATLGKLLMGIYVTDLEGNRVTFGRASVRYWVKYVSIAIVFIGFILAAFTRHKQALHDMAAGCLVLKR